MKFFRLLALPLTALLLVTSAAPVRAQTISQVLPGGSASATYKSDYVELENNQPYALNLSGWSLQYGSGDTGNFSWSSKVNLTGVLAPGQYFLLRLSTSSSVAADAGVPTADLVTTSFTLAATSGKLALVNSTATLPNANPAGNPAVLDLLGYGTTTSVYEGSGAAPVPTSTQSLARRNPPPSDTNDNRLDFTAGTPAFRNSSTFGGPIDFVPEPGTWAMLAAGAGLLGAGVLRRRCCV